jgi:site-specific recombinase XerD
METLPAVVSHREGALALAADRESEAMQRYLEAEKAPATVRAYRSDWAIFAAWCAERGREALGASPETVAMFLAAQAEDGSRPSTLSRRAASIRYIHASAGLEPPTSSELVRATMRGIRREIGTAPVRKVPATADLVERMVAFTESDPRGLRDRALILLGFAGAFRRSELVALDVGDLVESPEGLRVTIRHSKTDQEGAGQEIAIPRGNRLLPVDAVRAWLDFARISEGPVFRRVSSTGTVLAHRLTDKTVTLVVKDYARRAGLKAKDFAGHSLRSGFLTSGAEGGASVFKLMEVSRHKSVDVLAGYVRRADLFKDHAGSGFL